MIPECESAGDEWMRVEEDDDMQLKSELGRQKKKVGYIRGTGADSILIALVSVICTDGQPLSIRLTHQVAKGLPAVQETLEPLHR